MGVAMATRPTTCRLFSATLRAESRRDPEDDDSPPPARDRHFNLNGAGSIWRRRRISPYPDSTVPFLIRLFVTEGPSNSEPPDEYHVYAWQSSTLTDLIHQLQVAIPSLLDCSTDTRLIFRRRTPGRCKPHKVVEHETLTPFFTAATEEQVMCAVTIAKGDRRTLATFHYEIGDVITVMIENKK